tara:strand:+ start:2481 stop:2636 length:156 start_codon:yes stop_codon:yes gene_type:complete
MSDKKYDGWLVSDSLIKRSMAVYGHSIIAQIMVMIPFMALIIFASLLESCV